jgi:hypothetical protein
MSRCPRLGSLGCLSQAQTDCSRIEAIAAYTPDELQHHRGGMKFDAIERDLQQI